MISQDSLLVVVIVFYNPTDSMISRADLLSHYFRVIVSDNSVESIKNKFDFDYIHNHTNLGIGEAQNIAINQAISYNPEYILFLDQDSTFSHEEIKELIKVFNQISRKDSNIAALGPYPFNIHDNELYKTTIGEIQAHYGQVEALISSGCLIKKSALMEVGLLDKNLFIDYVDFDWCWRALSKGYTLYMTKDVVLKHQVGKGTLSFCGMSFILSAPFRYYYQYRNYLLLVTQKYVPIKWKLSTAGHLFVQFFLFFFHKSYRGNRKEILSNTLRGLKDGIKG